MNKLFVTSFLLFLFIIGLSRQSSSFEEQGEVTIGVKRGSKLAKKKLGTKNPILSEINFLIYDEKREEYKLLKDKDEVISGQQFMLNIKSNQKTYLYVLNIDATNTIYKLFPHEGITKKNPIEAEKEVIIPANANETNGNLFEFDSKTGLENFYIFLSTKPIPEVEKLIATISQEGVSLVGENQGVKKELTQLSAIGERSVLIAKNKTKKTFKQLGDKEIKLNPYMVWFKDQYTRKLVLIHKANAEESVSLSLIKQADQEKLKINNLLKNEELKNTGKEEGESE